MSAQAVSFRPAAASPSRSAVSGQPHTGPPSMLLPAQVPLLATPPLVAPLHRVPVFACCRRHGCGARASSARKTLPPRRAAASGLKATRRPSRWRSRIRCTVGVVRLLLPAPLPLLAFLLSSPAACRLLLFCFPIQIIFHPPLPLPASCLASPSSFATGGADISSPSSSSLFVCSLPLATCSTSRSSTLSLAYVHVLIALRRPIPRPLPHPLYLCCSCSYLSISIGGMPSRLASPPLIYVSPADYSKLLATVSCRFRSSFSCTRNFLPLSFRRFPRMLLCCVILCVSE